MLVALAAAALLAGCGSDDPAGPRTPTTTAPAPGTPTTVRGLGFTTVTPAGWENAGGAFNDAETRYDVAWADPRPKTGPKPSLLVLRRTDASILRRGLAGTAAANRRRYEREPGVRVGPDRSVSLAGTPALETVLTGSDGGTEIVRREVIAFRGRTFFSIVVSGAAADRGAERALAAAVAGWRWTS